MNHPYITEVPEVHAIRWDMDDCEESRRLGINSEVDLRAIGILVPGCTKAIITDYEIIYRQGRYRFTAWPIP